MRAAILAGETWSGEVPCRKAGGDSFWGKISLSPIRSPQGDLLAALFAAEDISLRVQAETKLKQQALWLQFISDAVIATDTSLLITSWNEAAVKIYGWEASEAFQQPLDKLLKTEFIGVTQEEAQTVLLQQGLWRGRVRQQSKTGQALILDAAVTFLRDSEGKITGGITINRDVTGLQGA
jgi:PAS domain S-box-containing protein